MVSAGPRVWRVDADLAVPRRDHVDGDPRAAQLVGVTCPLRPGTIRSSTSTAIFGRRSGRTSNGCSTPPHRGRCWSTSRSRARRSPTTAARRRCSHARGLRGGARAVDREPRLLEGAIPERARRRPERVDALRDAQRRWSSCSPRVAKPTPSGVLAASVSGDGYVPVGPRQLPDMIAAYHDPRGRSWFAPTRSWHATSVPSKRARRAAGLPAGADARINCVCEDQLVDRDMAHFAQARTPRDSGGAAAWTFHTRTSVRSRQVSRWWKSCARTWSTEASGAQSKRSADDEIADCRFQIADWNFRFRSRA